jgi:hypothetical protein
VQFNVKPTRPKAYISGILKPKVLHSAISISFTCYQFNCTFIVIEIEMLMALFVAFIK